MEIWVHTNAFGKFECSRIQSALSLKRDTLFLPFEMFWCSRSTWYPMTVSFSIKSLKLSILLIISWLFNLGQTVSFPSVQHDRSSSNVKIWHRLHSDRFGISYLFVSKQIQVHSLRTSYFKCMHTLIHWIFRVNYSSSELNFHVS